MNEIKLEEGDRIDLRQPPPQDWQHSDQKWADVQDKHQGGGSRQVLEGVSSHDGRPGGEAA
eukprot:3843544-Lingulodinium_polyedra.AAC.1